MLAKVDDGVSTPRYREAELRLTRYNNEGQSAVKRGNAHSGTRRAQYLCSKIVGIQAKMRQSTEWRTSLQPVWDVVQAVADMCQTSDRVMIEHAMIKILEYVLSILLSSD